MSEVRSMMTRPFYQGRRPFFGPLFRVKAPVTRHPPHRPVLEDFPHTVPQFRPFLPSHQPIGRHPDWRAKMLEALVDQGLKLPGDCPEKWVVDCKNVGNGDKAIIYLGRYLYRGVIQEKDILRCEDGMVMFRYQDSESKKFMTRTVTGEKFLYLLMLHALPKGFRRTRCYGFLHPCSKKLIKFLQVVLRVNPLRMLAGIHKKRPAITCPVCGAEMKIIRTRITRPLVACP